MQNSKYEWNLYEYVCVCKLSQPVYMRKSKIATSPLEQWAVNLGEMMCARVCFSVFVAMKTALEKRDSTPTIPAGTGG